MQFGGEWEKKEWRLRRRPIACLFHLQSRQLWQASVQRMWQPERFECSQRPISQLLERESLYVDYGPKAGLENMQRWTKPFGPTGTLSSSRVIDNQEMSCQSLRFSSGSGSAGYARSVHVNSEYLEIFTNKKIRLLASESHKQNCLQGTQHWSRLQFFCNTVGISVHVTTILPYQGCIFSEARD